MIFITGCERGVRKGPGTCIYGLGQFSLLKLAFGIELGLNPNLNKKVGVAVIKNNLWLTFKIVWTHSISTIRNTQGIEKKYRHKKMSEIEIY